MRREVRSMFDAMKRNGIFWRPAVARTYSNRSKPW
jgi:hypothetical protein